MVLIVLIYYYSSLDVNVYTIYIINFILDINKHSNSDV